MSEAQARSPAGLSDPSDPFDALVDEIHFVVRREADAAWRYARGANRRRHILAFAADGRAHYECHGRGFTVQAGQLLFFPRGTVHAGRSDPRKPWTFYSTAFTLRSRSGGPGAERALNAALAEVGPLVQLPNHHEVQAMFRQLERLWIERQPAYAMHCRAIVQQVLAMSFAAVHGRLPDVPHAHRIAAIMQMLQRQGEGEGVDGPWQRHSVAELADMAGLSPSRFRTLFHQVTGQSVVRYQNALRINRAKDLLLSGECTVTEAAELVGFRDVYYFSRLFKKMTGVTPSTLRQR